LKFCTVFERLRVVSIIYRISDSRVVLAGGIGGIRSTYFLNLNDYSWTEGPELNSESNFGHECSIYKNNEDILLLLTGYDYNSGVITTEILNFSETNPQWRVISTWQMNDSEDANLVTIADNSRAFLLGILGSNGYKDIYELNCESNYENCDWIKTQKQLQVDRYKLKATFVLPDDSGIC